MMYRLKLLSAVMVLVVGLAVYASDCPNNGPDLGACAEYPGDKSCPNISIFDAKYYQDAQAGNYKKFDTDCGAGSLINNQNTRDLFVCGTVTGRKNCRKHTLKSRCYDEYSCNRSATGHCEVEADSKVEHKSFLKTSDACDP